MIRMKWVQGEHSAQGGGLALDPSVPSIASPTITHISKVSTRSGSFVAVRSYPLPTMLRLRMLSRTAFSSIACLMLSFAFMLVLSACSNDDGTTPPDTPREVDENAYRTTPSGLMIYDFSEGSGTVADSGDAVTVNYTGWLRSDSTRFDSSIGGDPFTFTLGRGRVIRGWDEGVQGMSVGSERSLVIPPELAYGDRGAGNVIPPGATLIFEIELLSIEGS